MSGPYFVVFGLPGGGTRTRLGITATRKCGGSVVRNRLKRVVREVFRHRKSAVAIPIDLVVNVKPSAAAATYEALAGDLCRRLDDLERRFSA